MLRPTGLARLAAASLPRHKSNTQKLSSFRSFTSTSVTLADAESTSIGTHDQLRNIGISAHIDSGKTTLTERILFYTGRINAIHEVRGKDGVGAKMDSMDLEREKGITIQSAATFTKWGDTAINIIDTPGHVDFTIEVERSLRVLDGAVLVLCAVGGVQSQTITVDRQMKRYNVPRVIFINKLDRQNSRPFEVIKDVRNKLHLNAVCLQVPIGLQAEHVGVVDLVSQDAIFFRGDNGERMVREPVPADMIDIMNEKRTILIEAMADLDEEIGDLYLCEEEIPEPLLRKAIRKATIDRKLVPVFMGTAFKNRGVQALLDGVVAYMPCPTDVKNYAMDVNNNEAEVELTGLDGDKLVCLAFKLEEGRFGQLTYMRVYQGTLARGMVIRNVATGKKIKVPRLVRMHSDEMEDVESVGSGEICAMFGVECNSGDTFCDNSVTKDDVLPTMTSMFVPDPVVSLAIKPASNDPGTKFGKALQRFQREDPSFRVHMDEESKQTIISGMGELHLEVYVERMKREYSCECVVGAPKVNYRETISKKANFNYLHKKQTGGSGQYAKIAGYIEPLEEEELEEQNVADSGEHVPQNKKKKKANFVFENHMIGNAIPPEFLPAIERGFEERMNKGDLVGAPVTAVRVVITDGQAHSVDSSEHAFQAAAVGAFREAYQKASPVLMEPIMKVDISVPDEYQGSVVGGLNRRRGVIQDALSNEGYCTIDVDVPLVEMFGYATEIRSATQAKGEFSMEYKLHERVNSGMQMELVAAYKAEQLAKQKK